MLFRLGGVEDRSGYRRGGGVLGMGDGKYSGLCGVRGSEECGVSRYSQFCLFGYKWNNANFSLFSSY